MKALNTLAFVFALVLGGMAGCRKDDRPATLPRPEAPAARLAELRTEMLALVGDVPVGGLLPESLEWSPAGSSLAFLRRRTLPKQGSELWLHELAGHRDRPLVGQRGEESVDEFCFAAEGELALVKGGQLSTITVNGEQQPLSSEKETVHSLACAPSGRRLAFVRGNDLYALDLATKVETRLTSDGSGDRLHGEVPWLYREELDFGPGLVWSADGAKLVWLTTDLKGVRRATTWSPTLEPKGEAYPRPGEALPRASLSVASFARSGAATIQRLDTGSGEDTYLVRPVWRPSGEQLLVFRLDRLQTLLELLACDAKGACRVLHEQRDPRFLEPPPAAVPAPNDELLVLASTSGWSHIHALSRDGLHLRQLTSGSFEVASIDAVDPAAALVYFTANAESQGEQGLYSVPLRGGRVRRVSHEPGSHSALWSRDAKLLADTHSDIDRSPRLEIRVRSREDEQATVVMPQDLSPYKPPSVTTDFFELEAQDGRRLSVMLTRPAVLGASQRYPVLIYVYGGPSAQMVSRKFSRKLSAWRDSMARRGVLVWTLDGRGAAGYGRDHAVAVHTRLLGPEVEDQLVGLEYLLRQPYTDPKRIGVFGWSYGGTMALTLATHPASAKKLRAAVAVAPVTSFAEYDATYTERYLQRPADNPEGYARTDLTTKAGELRANLLLVHGLADNNVHFDHSARMLRALIDAGRPVETAFYPGESHGLKGPGTLADAMARITDFLLRNL